ncbi:MAG: YitT family protein [Oscillospiraceae bacterium]|nr:YitT family protein [Oscillospiraceae bacterium]
MKQFANILLVLLGNLLYALSVKLFLLPAGLITGGTNGMALALQHYWDVPISLFVLVFNIVMLLVGWFVLGKKFAMTTVISSFAYPAFLELLDKLMGNVQLTDDLLLCTIFFGLGVGLGLGLVIRSGASTGGMDIPPLILEKKFRIPVSVSMYCFDFLILVPQMFFRPVENVLYGIILVFIYTMVLDKMLILGKSKTELKIVSPKYEEICAAILTEVDRGVTLMRAEGGYSGCKTKMVFSVVSNRELIKVEKLVHEIDPECFMVVSRVSEVRGKGFSIKKEYQ